MGKRLTQPLFLIGFAGSGKTTLGAMIAKRLRVLFFDTDELIERHTGKTVSEVFAEEGERYFRALETVIIADLVSQYRDGVVIALGGGSLLKSENRKLVASAGPVVYLSCSQQELYRRLKNVTDRPLLVSGSDSARSLKDKVKTLLNRRVAGYRTADYTVSTTNRTTAEVIARILGVIRK